MVSRLSRTVQEVSIHKLVKRCPDRRFPGSQQCNTNVLRWLPGASKQSGVLRVKGVTHHRLGESNPPELFREDVERSGSSSRPTTSRWSSTASTLFQTDTWTKQWEVCGVCAFTALPISTCFLNFRWTFLGLKGSSWYQTCMGCTSSRWTVFTPDWPAWCPSPHATAAQWPVQEVHSLCLSLLRFGLQHDGGCLHL